MPDGMRVTVSGPPLRVFSHARTHGTVRALARVAAAFASLVLLHATGRAQEATRPQLQWQDPALQYAEIAPLARYSLLLDLVRAGERIVAVGERGHVLLSDDRGETWRQARVPAIANLTGVFFVDSRRGWAVGHDEIIVRSVDGGENWTRVHFAPEKQQPLLAVWFRDAERGFALGAYGTILATTDGGTSWQVQPFDPRPIGATRSAAAGGDGYSDEPLPGDMHLNAIAASSTGKLYIAAEAGHIFRSDDEGASWLVLPSPYEGSFFGVLPLEGESLLAFGLRGHLFHSADAGVTWRRIDTGSVAMLTDGVRSNGTIAICGLAGTMLLSRDDGQSFSLEQFPDRRGMNAVLALDAARFVVVGEGGVRIVSP